MAREVLVVDDDQEIRAVLKAALEADGYDVAEAGDGAEALSYLEHSEPALILLDVVMPDLNGTELCRLIRARSNVPIVFLSRRSDYIDRIVGLEVGADDYITKPFHPREVSARVRAVLRRSVAASEVPNPDAPQSDDEPVVHGALKLVPLSRHVYWSGEVVALTKTEYELLEVLVRWRQKVYSRAELIDKLHGWGTHVTERTIDSHVRNIRQKFQEAGAPALHPIETVRGVGFTIVDST